MHCENAFHFCRNQHYIVFVFGFVSSLLICIPLFPYFCPHRGHEPPFKVTEYRTKERDANSYNAIKDILSGTAKKIDCRILFESISKKIVTSDTFIVEDLDTDTNEIANGPLHIIYDAVSIHAPNELDILEVRLAEYYPYVHRFFVVEFMYYTTGERRDHSLFDEMKENKLKKYPIIELALAENKLVHHQIWTNIYQVGLQQMKLDPGSDKLTVFHFNEVSRNDMARLVFEDCFREFGDACLRNNTERFFYMILSDVDEIVKQPILQLLSQCYAQESYPMRYIAKKNARGAIPVSRLLPFATAIFIQPHTYDFGCQDPRRSYQRLKILPLSQIWTFADDKERNFDSLKKVQYNTMSKKLIEPYVKSMLIGNGGWHLTYFGDANDALFKNQRRGHQYSRIPYNINISYLECIIGVCGFTMHARSSQRIPNSDLNELRYYGGQLPQYFQRSMYAHPLLNNSFLRKRFETDPELFEQYLTFKKTTDNVTVTPEQYCANNMKDLSKKQTVLR